MENSIFNSNVFIINLIYNLSLKIFHEINVDLASIEIEYNHFETSCRRFKFKFEKGQWFILESYKERKYFTIHFFDEGLISKFSFIDEKSFFECWKLAEEKIIEELKK